MQNNNDFQQRASCLRKTPYSSKVNAENAQRDTEVMTGKEEGLEVYRCILCGLWHLGHNRRTMRRARRLLKKRRQKENDDDR